jgi:peptidoglycan/xylan/chitin deacetylase (PgdA/CDA1 family)
VEWLKGIAAAGHPVGNHTYDHVNVKATRAEDVQFRFQRAPWLIEGKTPAEAIRENIRMTGRALKLRTGIEARGFRTPGGFTDGLADRADVQAMLLDLGFRWVSSKYPAHPNTSEGVAPGPEVFGGIVKAQAEAQPFVYPSGLVEVPMSPPSDVTAMRAGRWRLSSFLEAVRRGVEWAIERRAVFDFLGHPSCLHVADPRFETIDLICELVRTSGERAVLADVDALAGRAQSQ